MSGSRGAVASRLPMCLLLGRIASGPLHLKKNKELGGTYTPFSPLLTGTPPLHHASTPFLTLPKTQALECLAPKEADYSLLQHSL